MPEMSHTHAAGGAAGSTAGTAGNESESTIVARAEHAAEIAGEQLTDAADTLRDRVAETPGATGRVARRLADSLAGTGNYVQEAGIGGALEDLTLMIRRYPMQTLLAGVVLGYLLARWRTR